MQRLAALLLALAALPAAAQTGRLVDVAVMERDTGRTLPLYARHGRIHVPGDPGARYAVVLTNRTPERLLAVLSVDGVNAISGETASAQQSGYVLAPYGRTEVRGWRKNLGETAEFYFTELPDSYAARTDRPENVGVIGVAVYRERERWVEPPAIGRERQRDAEPWRGRKSGPGSADAEAGAAAPQSKSLESRRAQELGTGHGERRWDPARVTSFERRSPRPDEVVALYYDSARVLIARGIMPPPRRSRYTREPDPFPLGFAPDPYR